MRFINDKQVFSMIELNRLSIIIDVRGSDAYKLGHIPGAINVSSDYIEEIIDILNDYKEESILIYCSKGYDSVNICKYLEKHGFTNMYNLLNGLDNYSYKTV
ncbi:MAG: rhodanese-like domain-containing protein [Paraclostridium sp.]